MESKSKRVGTFKEFLKEQAQKKLNEARVSLEIEWWDDCIVEVMQVLKDECNGFLDYETLVMYVKNKFQILGRPDPGFEEAFLLQHIKDLIFQLHGDSLVFDGMCNWGDSSEVQAKGLAVSELSKVILDKVMETIKSPDDPIPGARKVSMVDKEPRTLVPMTETVPDEDDFDDYEDYVGEKKKVRTVKGFKDFTKSLNEGVAIIEAENREKCIKYCLDRVMKEVGSYDPEKTLDVAVQAADPKIKARVVLLYVKNMVIDYMSQQKTQLGLVDAGGKKGKTIPEDVLAQGLDLLYQDIADEVLVALADINGISVEDEETE